jgi:lipopolysaccharide transport system permease protein
VVNPFQFLWRHRNLIWHTTLSDIRARYTGSVFGMAWAILNPLLLLSVYVVLYLVIFKIQLPGLSSVDYVLVIFTGLIPWFGFSEAITASLISVVSNANLLRSTSFPTPALPAKAVLASMFTQVIGLSLLLIALILTGHVSRYWLFLPVAVGVQLLLTIGLGWVLSVLNVFIRDLMQAISVVLLFLMFISPIAYVPEMIDIRLLRVILALNPLHYLINLYRMPLFYGRLPSPLDVAISLGLALLVFWGGYRFFVRIKPHLVDYV